MAKIASSKTRARKTGKKTETPWIANTEFDKVFSFIGISNTKSIASGNDETDFINYIRKGLPNIVITRLGQKIDISESELSLIFHVSRRTLQRRRSTQLLNQEQTERAIEIARLYTRGEEVFTNIENFKLWMDTQVLAFGRRKPKEFLDTSIGINLLMDELGRIEHGVYS